MRKLRPGTGSSSTGRRPGRDVLGVPRAGRRERRCAARRSAGSRLLEQLEDAVASRLMSDVPLGAMLSGGLDSSLVVALMARQMSEPVKTFTVGFAGTRRQRARRRRGRSRAHFGTDHHELELSLDDPIDLDALVWSLDEPLADLSASGSARSRRSPAEHVTVALSGQGADELLAGYDRYGQTRAVERLARLPGPLLRAAAASRGRASRARPRGARRALHTIASRRRSGRAPPGPPI